MDQKWLTLCWKRRWGWRGGVLVRLISELREQFISILIPHKGHHFQRLITISSIIKPNAIQITQPLQMRFLNCICSSSSWGFGGSNEPPPWLRGKEYACKAGDKVSIPGQEDWLQFLPGGGNATHSSILAGKSHGGGDCQATVVGVRSIEHEWATKLQQRGHTAVYV